VLKKEANAMKVTKFVHACLLVEMPEPVNRTALFDPGIMSEEALDVDALEYLDDIVITHIHNDHVSVKLMKQLVEKFPEVRITSTPEVLEMLQKEGIPAAHMNTEPPEGMEFFESPHESVQPMFESPQEIGVHYLDLLSHPGDSHSFHETKAVLALPITAPWGSMVKAVNLALELKPKFILPIHDWHWRDEARGQTYNRLDGIFKQYGITFVKLKNGEPVVIDVSAA
jgi:L-ascorbate metabolism protein UlaG (beta-lactamase superfamily)